MYTLACCKCTCGEVLNCCSLFSWGRCSDKCTISTHRWNPAQRVMHYLNEEKSSTKQHGVYCSVIPIQQNPLFRTPLDTLINRHNYVAAPNTLTPCLCINVLKRTLYLGLFDKQTHLLPQTPCLCTLLC